MELTLLDYSIISGFFLLTLAIGLLTAKKSSKNIKSFFLSDRNMPWWLLGVSMVATTFAADTPGLVTELVRVKGGVSGNWVWWAMLLTGMLTVFFYAKLWRKSGITTDLEFYELRYSGKAASFLRGFRAIYLGIIFNIVIMAGVCLAGAKIASILLGLSQGETLLIASVVTVIYSSLGGLRGVLLTDFVQFIIAMVGSIWATVYIVNMPEIGGLNALLTHPNVSEKLSIFPDFSSNEALITLFIIPLAVQWWSTWYPGAEPGGGGYIAQRMLAAKDEKNAIWAVLLFNFAHYALRPWPWILVGLASLVIYPNLDSLSDTFPNLSAGIRGDDVAYSAMLVYLPAGLIGLVLTSLVAAFMSTISSQLNWGASYIVNDFYNRFVRPESTDKEQVLVGRISTVVLMALAAGLSFYIQSAKEIFDLMLQIGAGTGLLFILRWFWHRINPYSEIAAMAISFFIALIFFFNEKLEDPWFVMEGHWKLITGVFITTVGWVIVTLVTKPSDKETLTNFNAVIFGEDSKFKNFNYKIFGFVCGVFGVYAMLFGIGHLIYGNFIKSFIAFFIVLVTMVALKKIWSKIV